MKVGVALGGGGVRGLAHLLALEALDELGVRPAAVAGTSMGAIIGAAYASGLPAAEIRSQISHHIIERSDHIRDIYRKKKALAKWLKFVRPTTGKSGFLRPDGFLAFLFEGIPAASFDELAVPLTVVATDFYSGDPVLIRTGALTHALSASMAIPGVFVPVERDGRWLVDGGLADNLPYAFLPESCDTTIAIDVAPTRTPEATGPPGTLDAIFGMFDFLIEERTAAALAAAPPTIYVRPALTGIRTLDIDKIEEVFAQARPAIEKFKRDLDSALGAP